MKPPKHILPIIVFSQFCGTSLWFSGNAVITELVRDFALAQNATAHLTSAVQFGFIIGTLIFALLAVADRFSPSKVFVLSSLIAAGFNLGVIWQGNTIETLLVLRFMTGFFLAGIYPVGMKIAADYFDKGLGRSLGFLVGALVLGTAFPHILKGFLVNSSWQMIMTLTSSVAGLGGFFLVILVPDGPYRKEGKKLNLTNLVTIFKNRSFTQAATGYFGHMWELYAFWSIVPLILTSYNKLYPSQAISISLGSFSIIAIGTLSCILGGFISEKVGVTKTATWTLLGSAMCCIVSPLLFEVSSSIIVLTFLCIWGMLVIADSPLFSTLVAQNAQASQKGTAITIVTCIGFAITIMSIELLYALSSTFHLKYILPILGIGPMLSLLLLQKKRSH